MQNRVLITGARGQDGWYLAERLAAEGAEIHGTTSRTPPQSGSAVHRWHRIDFDDVPPLVALLDDLTPAEIYHLAGASRVGESFRNPLASVRANGMATARLLDAIIEHRRKSGNDPRLFVASTGLIFGSEPKGIIYPETEPRPDSPYACGKHWAQTLTRNYREAHHLFAAVGVLFNHESPRRPESFVSRKITAAAARIARGEQQQLTLDTFHAWRDWGYAGDYVTAMRKSLAADEPGDYLIATGITRPLTVLLDAAFSAVDLDWKNSTIAADDSTPFPADATPPYSVDISSTKSDLDWEPTTEFSTWVRQMVEADV